MVGQKLVTMISPSLPGDPCIFLSSSGELGCEEIRYLRKNQEEKEPSLLCPTIEQYAGCAVVSQCRLALVWHHTR